MARELLSLQEAAKRLQVHPNTARNWVKNGTLTAVKTPGSDRIRGFEPAEIEHFLAKQLEPYVPPTDNRSRFASPELVGANDIIQWAQSSNRHAQDTFPQLMRRLLAADPGVTDVVAPAHEGVSKPGWDVSLTATGSTRLPDGAVRIELGVNKAMKAKAQEDFDKRTKTTPASERRLTTFVFATPRRWRDGPKWASDQAESSDWADVRVIDVDSIEPWLEESADVHWWFSEQLGRRPDGAETLSSWWRRFISNRQRLPVRDGSPITFPASFFLAGRQEHAVRLREVVERADSPISVSADSVESALAFLGAAMDDPRARPAPEIVLVHSHNVWNRLVGNRQRLGLLPLFPDPDIDRALRAGHQIIRVGTRETAMASARSISIGRIDSAVARDELVELGVGHSLATEQGVRARRSFAAFVRRSAVDPVANRPQWATGRFATSLAPLVLAGAWSDTPADRATVAQLFGGTIEQVEDLAHEVSRMHDAPLYRTQGGWRFAALDDAILLLAPSMTSSMLERHREIARSVFNANSLEEHPAGIADLLLEATNPKDRWSGTLRRGLGESLAALGALEDSPTSESGVTTKQAASVVRRLLAGEGGQVATSRVWAGLADVLPLMAEASPEQFLDAVELSLEVEPSPLAELFLDQPPLVARSPHTGLLWALEKLCWSEQHFFRAALGLARLEFISPASKSGNRPISSLYNVLVSWVRHTGASTVDRQEVFQAIAHQMPDVAWRLLLRVLPSHSQHSSPPSEPQFRDWVPTDQSVSIGDWMLETASRVSLAIKLAIASPERWIELVTRLGGLPPDDAARAIGQLELDVALWNDEQRNRFWQTAHKEVAKHREFPGARWSLGADLLERLDGIIKQLGPKSATERAIALFDEWHPRLASFPEGRTQDLGRYEAALDEARTVAVQEVSDETGIEGIRLLATRVRQRRLLGWTLRHDISDELQDVLLGWLGGPEEPLHEVAISWVSARIQADGLTWAAEIIGASSGLESAVRAQVALAAPATAALWDLLANDAPEIVETYWSQVHLWRVEPQDTVRAVDELLARERPWIAIEAAASGLALADDEPSVLPPALIADCLSAAYRIEPDAPLDSTMVAYYIGKLLDYAATNGLDVEQLVQLELQYFDLLDDTRTPEALYAVLRTDSSLFVALLKVQYRSDTETESANDTASEIAASNAWSILYHWRQMPMTDDGVVNEAGLRTWVHTARSALSDSGRLAIGDQEIGKVLGMSPAGSDGAWPAEPVRDLVEELSSRDLETGLFGSRIGGITMRGAYAGGDQERAQSLEYRAWALTLRVKWPRTSRLLSRLAEYYEREAKDRDNEAEHRRDEG